jgi:hypothetical protein
MTDPTRAGPAPAADLAAFFGRHGRLPRLGDAVPPWRCRGWLLPYLIRLHAACPAVADRWGCHLRTLEAGRLLDEPIPQVRFGPPDPRVGGLLRDWSALVGRDLGGWEDFRALADWLGWALALSGERPRVGDDRAEQLYRQVGLRPLLERPHDYFCARVSEGRARGWNPAAFYPTPHEVAEFMARLTFHDLGGDGPRPARAKRV